MGYYERKGVNRHLKDGEGSRGKNEALAGGFLHSNCTRPRTGGGGKTGSAAGGEGRGALQEKKTELCVGLPQFCRAPQFPADTV